MVSYADVRRVKERSGIGADDLALTDRTGDGNVTEDDLDELIGELGEQASDTVDRYCRRTFTKTTETVAVDGTGRRSLRLPGYPVISISSVTVGDDDLAADEYRIRDDDSTLPDDNSGILERKSGTFPDRWENVEISYTWGYETTPPSVVSVAEELVISALRSAAAGTSGAQKGAQSFSMDGFSVTFDDSVHSLIGQLTPEQKEQLDDHRRVVVA